MIDITEKVNLSQKTIIKIGLRHNYKTTQTLSNKEKRKISPFIRISVAY